MNSTQNGRGRIVVVEGLDGCGKSTLCRGLIESLNAVALATSASTLGDARPAVEASLRDSALARHLFFASLVASTAAEARRWAEIGRDVVIDRFWLSTRAYGRAVRGLEVALAEVEQALHPADLTLFLEARPGVRRARLAQRSASAGEVNVEDLATLRPDLDAALRADFVAGLSCPVAGRGVVLDVSDLSPQDVLGRALRELEQVRQAA